MKLEAMLLRSLCVIGMLISALVFGTMLITTATPAADRMATNTAQPNLVACSQLITVPVLPATRD